ncbi:SMI1/KNR4 family protein [Nonomuraea pusilla]|uniref:SMI1/KNR4 family protein n=1 Tax=Nonomuraea pusilla TaxID=46177 RepID=UPI00116066D4|nr:SMI1/KNR4 family protein [Nonomuraea pusilla]
MRRLITSRGLWLALAAAGVVAAVLVIVRARRRPAGLPRAPQDDASAPAPTPEAAPWPPAPVLGVPTAEELERYVPRPSPFGRPASRRLSQGGGPREPLDGAGRRRLTRVGVAGLALLVLAVAGQLLESAVFAEEPFKQATSVSSDPRTLHLQREEPPAPPTPDADCDPPRAVPRVRAVNPKVTRAVNRQWRRIETWLRAHAPRSYRTLGRPGRPGTIAVAEAQMGVRFPDDLRASLLRHDGGLDRARVWGFGFLGASAMSVREIRDTWREQCGLDADEGTGPHADPRGDRWDGRMIPFAAYEGGDRLVIDSVVRDIGETDVEGGMSFDVGGMPLRSYYALLKATADAMENGGTVGYWKPEAVAGVLEWRLV